MSELDIKGTVGVELKADTTKATSELKKVSEQTKKTEKTFLGLKASSIAVGAVAGVAFAGFTREVSKAIKVGMEFEATLSKVKAVSGATEKQFKDLSDNARRLGSSTSFTATEVASLQVEYAKLGFTADEIGKVTEATLNLAKASGEDLASSAEVAGGVVRAYNLQAEEATRVTDVMAKSFSTSALDLQKFKVAIGQSGKVASDAGLSIEDTASALGLLANQNIRAETAGVGLRNILLKLNEDGSKVGDMLGGGVTSLSDLVERLKVAKGDTDLFRKAQKDLGTENAVVFSSLVSNIDKLEEYSGTLKESRGEAKKMSDVMGDNLQGDITLMTSALDGLRIAFFDAFNEDGRKSVQGMTEAIQGFRDGAELAGKAVGTLSSALTGIAQAFSGVDFSKDIDAVTDKFKLTGIDKEIESAKEELEAFQSQYGTFASQLPQYIEARKKYLGLLKEEKRLRDEAESKAKEVPSLLTLNPPKNGSTSAASSTDQEDEQTKRAKQLVEQYYLDFKEAHDMKIELAEIEKQKAQEYFEYENNLSVERQKREVSDTLERIRLAKEESEAKFKSAQMFFRGWSSLTASMARENKGLAEVSRGLAIAEAIMNTYKGANLALASAPPPFGAIAMSGVIAQGLANVNQIRAQKFATGGIVGGSSYFGDKVPIMANSGEEILPAYDPRHRNNINSSVSNSRNYNITLNMNASASQTDIRSMVQTLRYELDEMERLDAPARY